VFKTGADGLGYYKDTGQWRMESEETKNPLDPEYDMDSHLRGDHQVRDLAHKKLLPPRTIQ